MPSIAELDHLENARTRRSPIIDRWARRQVLAKLCQLAHGRLRLIEPQGELDFASGRDEDELNVSLSVHDPRFYAKVALGGSIGAGEAFMAGYWSTDDLTKTARLMVRNRDVLNHLERGWAWLASAYHRLQHVVRGNTRRGSRRNIAAHYDLSNEFFALFLDRRMMYSSAIFEPGDGDLDGASEAKLERICRKLDLQPGDNVLEIGTGWGGFAIYAARRYGCHVTTTTISPAQYRHATARVAAARLEERVVVLQRDYRELEGRFDKLVSIEMIEAVGHRFLETFFQVCSERLKGDGLMVLQAITIADRFYEQAKRSVDFIQRYIFPGSAIPSLHVMLAALTRATDLTLVHAEDIGLHYARTLGMWRERLIANHQALREQGFSDTFARMWEFYFSYCEGGFLERSISDVQLVLSKPRRSLLKRS